MPIEHVWESKRVLRIRYTGVISGREMIRSSLEISGDARMDDLRAVIGDWSEVEKADLSTQDVEELVAYIKAMAQSNPLIKNATVMSGDEAGMALASFYKFLTEEVVWETALFHSLEDARTWISV